MPKSLRFRTLTRELNRLKKQFIPKTNPTGLYSDRQLARTLAYRVLAHAEIESYLEERAWDVVQNAKTLWDTTGKTTRTLICLLGFSGLTMDKPPGTLNRTRGSRDDHDKRLKISKKIALSVNEFWTVIDKNHGVKEKNILALLLPIGIDGDDLDSAWLATMNTFGEKNRGRGNPTPTNYNLFNSYRLR
jgi:hypothetical protein